MQIRLILFFLVPSSPLNLSMAPVAGSPTQLSTSWFAPVPKNGIITGYSVYCNTSANQTYPEQVIGSNVPTIRSVVNGTTLAVIIRGFSPYTQFSCYVTANTSVGEGSTSMIVTVQTAQSGNIFALTATNLYIGVYTPHPMLTDKNPRVYTFVCLYTSCSHMFSASIWFSNLTLYGVRFSLNSSWCQSGLIMHKW